MVRAKIAKKVFVGMSGGVDSSVAAYLLKKQGYDVVGVFLRCFNVDGCAEQDAEDARRVASHLNIPFYVWDMEEDYKKKVVEYMVEGYKLGETPNPDVMCNREIKFGLFLKRALELGADYIATGHYVRLKKTESKFKLFAAKDTNKDQSYFLWTLKEEDLKHALFPIGDYLKPKVREIAKKAGLPTALKKDSQGICFLGQVSIADFLKNYLPEKKGEVHDLQGKKVGEHMGAEFYTIGQRQGIGNIKHAKGNQIHTPVYIAKKDVKNNLVIVAEGSNNPALFRDKISLKETNLISGVILKKGDKVLVRVRYRQPLQEAITEKVSKKQLSFKFLESQKFVAEGQSAVFYLKTGECLGGGVIA